MPNHNGFNLCRSVQLKLQHKPHIETRKRKIDYDSFFVVGVVVFFSFVFMIFSGRSTPDQINNQQKSNHSDWLSYRFWMDCFYIASVRCRFNISLNTFVWFPFVHAFFRPLNGDLFDYTCLYILWSLLHHILRCA